MYNGIKDLTATVKSQKQLYDEVLQLAKKKQAAIERGDSGELDYIVEAEQLLILELGNLEKSRNRIIDETAKKYGLDQSKLTVKNWPDATGKEKEQLLNLQKEFGETLKDVDNFNKTNQKLISMQLDYIKHVLESAGEKNKTNSYGSSGNIKRDKSDDAKVVDIRT